MTDTGGTELGPAHLALLFEARAGIERFVARTPSSTADVVFLVADAESALGRVILDLGVPRHPERRAVVIPLSRGDAARAAGPLMGPSVTAKLEAHAGPAVLVMAEGTARLVGL